MNTPASKMGTTAIRSEIKRLRLFLKDVGADERWSRKHNEVRLSELEAELAKRVETQLGR